MTIAPLPQIRLINNHSTYQWFTDKAYLAEEYVSRQKSAKQIARELGCSHSTILKYLSSFGITPKNVPRPRIPKGQTGFGLRVVRGHEVDSPAELAVIEKMKELRSQGLSYRKIAGVLNSAKVCTKNDGSRWHATTVMKILKRHFRMGRS